MGKSVGFAQKISRLGSAETELDLENFLAESRRVSQSITQSFADLEQIS